jgi:hypothetical protein|tara:strand:+ start:185 stop:688 length:504 start_codon:yes stop_codon:yes gene_type:complete
MSETNFNAIMLIDDVISVRKQGKHSIKSKEIRITDSSVMNFVTAIRELVDSIVLSKGSWKENNNSHLMNLIKEGMSFVKGYKHLTIDDKKRLILLLIDKVVQQEIENSTMADDIKNKLLSGIDDVVEPSIELAIRALTGELKVDETCVVHALKLVVRAIFICTKPQN